MNNVIDLIDTNDTKYQTLTEKYVVVPTRDIRNKFESLGFVVDSFQAKKVRDKSKIGFQKHLVRLSNPNLLSMQDHKDVKLQLLITNSHDGSTGFRMQLGFFRFVCSNGLIVGETFESISLRHTGSVIEQIDKAIEKMVAQVGTLSELLNKMKTTKLSAIQEVSFMTEALKIRSENASFNVVPMIRREEDKGNDLFTILNRAQETVIRGGDHARGNNGRVRRLRSVKSIDKEVELNRKLFDLAVKYAA